MAFPIYFPKRRSERGNTAAVLTAANEILLAKEICVETDTGRFKFGDGVTAWNDLDYAAPGLFDLTGIADGDTLLWDDTAGTWTVGPGGGGASLATSVVDGDTTHAPDGNAVFDFVGASIATAVDSLTTLPKVPVRMAATGNVAIATLANGDVVDPGGGLTAATGDRVLLPNQADPTENGIYDIHASGPATRSSDADTGAELLYAQVYVQAGTHYGGKTFRCNTPGPIVVGTTAITWGIAASGDLASTDFLTEGTTNKYFTDERAQDATAGALAAGTHAGISFAYDDAGNAISATVSPGGILILGGSKDLIADLPTSFVVDGIAAAGYDITGWELLVYPSGSLTLDIRKGASIASAPTSITPTGKPAVAAATNATGGVTGWTSTAVARSNALTVAVVANSGVRWFALLLKGAHT